jgi:hypothetical protein
MISHETEDQEVHNKETAEATQAEIARLIHEFKKEKRENGRIIWKTAAMVAARKWDITRLKLELGAAEEENERLVREHEEAMMRVAMNLYRAFRQFWTKTSGQEARQWKHVASA